MKRVLIGKFCSFYYIIREEALCETVVNTNHATSTVLKLENFTRAKRLYHIHFIFLVQDMDAEHV
jgi:hypothetical protein